MARIPVSRLPTHLLRMPLSLVVCCALARRPILLRRMSGDLERRVRVAPDDPPLALLTCAVPDRTMSTADAKAGLAALQPDVAFGNGYCRHERGFARVRGTES